MIDAGTSANNADSPLMVRGRTISLPGGREVGLFRNPETRENMLRFKNGTNVTRVKVSDEALAALVQLASMPLSTPAGEDAGAWMLVA